MWETETTEKLDMAVTEESYTHTHTQGREWVLCVFRNRTFFHIRMTYN